MYKILLPLLLVCGVASAQVPVVNSYMTYGRSGYPGYGMNTSGAGTNVGIMFNTLSGADKWSLGYATSMNAVGSSILTWTTSKVGVMNTAPTYTLDVTGSLRATTHFLPPSVSSTTIASLVPAAVGDVVFNSTRYALCVGTATVAGAWIFQSSNPITTAGISCKE